MEEHLAAFTAIARDSREYQGHGWGCAWLEGGRWRLYRNIAPLWEDRWRPSGSTTLLLAHARSAFRDEGIRVENNMPFFDGERVFIFNGELHGVRIKEHGRIGAEKVFNFVKRFDHGDFRLALERGIDAIRKRSRLVRAMNMIVADSSARVHVATNFREDPEYFQMHTAEVNGAHVVCSEPYPQSRGRGRSIAGPAAEATPSWTPVGNGTVAAIHSD
ncbi:MAG: hypothetical protein OXE96_10330 [Gemmatimonadetes bacterium]|nr:hypothetical protein [Gemmatimonadota bacterium]